MIKKLILKLMGNKKEVVLELGEGFSAVLGYNGLYALKNIQGKILTDYKYEELHLFCNGVSKVKGGNGKYGYINRLGQEIVKPLFRVASDLKNKRAIVGNGFYFGIIDTTGEYVLPKNYTQIEVIDGVIIAKKNNCWFVFDIDGNEICENNGFILPPITPMQIYLRGLKENLTYAKIREEFANLLLHNNGFIDAVYEVKAEQKRYLLNKQRYNLSAQAYKQYREKIDDELTKFKQALLQAN